MNSNIVTCPHCGLSYFSTTSLGRHMQSMHRARRGNFPISEVRRTSDPTPETSNDLEIYEDIITDVCISDEVFTFYDELKDTSTFIFPSLPVMKIPLDQLCPPARYLFEFCSTRNLTRSQIAAQYELQVKCLNSNCICDTQLCSQFPKSSNFVRYVLQARNYFVAKQQWKRAFIQTKFGMNETGVFRSMLPIITNTVIEAGGIKSVLSCSKKYKMGERCYTDPQDADSMCNYFESMPSGTIIVGVDLYSDGTTISNSGSQTLCLLRMRVSNVHKASEQWHELAIEPVLNSTGSCTESVLSEERAMLKQRFLFVVLKDAIEASKTGFLLLGKLVYLRICTLVCDQKEERSLLSLKANGSYMDCTFCLLPSLSFTDNSSAQISHNLPTEAYAQDDDTVYNLQTSKTVSTEPRSVVNTVSRQIFVARSRMSAHFDNELYSLHRQEISSAKEYLKRTSANQFPPALSAFYGLGTNPFNLYKSIGLDKLHAVDLGVLRSLPDFSFVLFGSSNYNKGLISGRELVRIANSRFRNLKHISGVHILPFRANAEEKHACMTGKLRREIAPFLWVALLGLQPDTLPDQDLILQSSLALNKFQTLIRGINMPAETAERTKTDIENVQNIAFDACLWLSKSLALPITTKLHRVMRHVKDHLFQFGCSRRGDSDTNETLHKETKCTIKASNRKLQQIAAQVLAVRTMSSVVSSTQKTENSDTSMSTGVLFSFLGDEGTDSEEESSASEDEETLQSELTTEISSNAIHNEIVEMSIIHSLKGVCELNDIEKVKGAILELRHPVLLDHLWTPISRVSFDATLSWQSAGERSFSQIRQVARVSSCTRSTIHNSSAVEYSVGHEIRAGFLQLLIRGKLLNGAVNVAVIRRLKIISPEEGNRRVVDVYGHTRYDYVYSEHVESDVLLDCVLVSSIRRVLPIVPDMYDIVKRFSVKKKIIEVEDTKQERRLMKFFCVSGKQVTSFKGYSG